MKLKKIYPPTWLFLTLILMPVLGFFLPITSPINGLWRLLGFLLIIPGVWINLLADRAFHMAKTTVTPFEQSSALITAGVFRFTRNPMYLGFILILAGVAALLGALSPWLVVAAFAILIDRRFVFFEEQMLESRFGSKYEQYKHCTRRWL